MNYTAYGYSLSLLMQLSKLGYDGERIDNSSGCYPLGAGLRSYNPALMRFTSSDSLSPFGIGGINGYAYCSGDPVNYNDPTGKAPVPIRIEAGRSRRLKLTWNETRVKLNLSTPGELLELVKSSPEYLLHIEGAEASNVLNHVLALSRDPLAPVPNGLFASSNEIFQDVRERRLKVTSKIEAFDQAPSPEEAGQIVQQLLILRNQIKFERDRAHVRLRSVAKRLLAPALEDISSWRRQ
ncbi:RHS repeat-associated core domain-containing protein [Pseudomonas sp. NPDC089547]|uniref:RHS repeat-associated core domain-containing protein n=1 Tax=Pseudomonas sp. NPDC089547 TaxID=3390652 RepID=UPI003D06BCF8